ncbi:MAG: hypothetical protein ACKVQR_06030 [Aquabacterium sp.]
MHRLPHFWRSRMAGLSAAVLLCPMATQAALLANPQDFDAVAHLVPFNDPGRYIIANNQADIGGDLGLDLSVRALDGLLAFPLAGERSLGSNGIWPATLGFVTVDGVTDPDRGLYTGLLFDLGGRLARQIAVQVNFNPDILWGPSLPLPLYLAAYAADGQLLESHELMIRTPGAVGASQFVGIGRDQADIARFEVSAAAVAVDSLQVSTPIPEPPAVLMVGVACLILGVRTYWRTRLSSIED